MIATTASTKTPRLASIDALRRTCAHARNLRAPRSHVGKARQEPALVDPCDGNHRRKECYLESKSCPYNVPSNAGTLPDKNHVFTIPGHEATFPRSRYRAPRIATSPLARRPPLAGCYRAMSDASNITRGKSAPSHAPAASKCKMSAGRCTRVERHVFGRRAVARPCQRGDERRGSEQTEPARSAAFEFAPARRDRRLTPREAPRSISSLGRSAFVSRRR